MKSNIQIAEDKHNEHSRMLYKLLELSKKTTEELNALLQQAIAECDYRAEQIKEFAKQHKIPIRVSYDYGVMICFRELTGVSLSLNRLRTDFGSEPAPRYEWWYKVRNNIPLYYVISSADVKKDSVIVKVKGHLSYFKEPFDLRIVQEYKNGNVDYSADEGILKLVYIVEQIRRNFEGE